MAIATRLLPIALAALREGFEDEAGDLEQIEIPVRSTAIRSIAWEGTWRGDGIITVEFNRGGTYQYSGTKEQFLAFANAPSKGVFFNANFR